MASPPKLTDVDIEKAKKALDALSAGKASHCSCSCDCGCIPPPAGDGGSTGYQAGQTLAHWA